jgi:SAM-dependent methyltransferase
MSGFSADWLTLREPYDQRARNPVVMNAVIGAFKAKPTIRIVDLGCGTGSTLRTLAARLSANQDWRLIDHDPALLKRAMVNSSALAEHVETAAADLNRELEAVLQVPADLVTTSALLDLVSEEWSDRFVNCAAAHALFVYAALSYDGRIEIAPAHPLDEVIVRAVNLHQRGDKGFGPALGPLAGETVIAKFMRRGYSVVQGAADWIASEQDRAFQTEIVRGWAAAVQETGALSASDLKAWLSFRQNEIAAGRATLRVGHVDFFAAPASAR